MWRRYTYRNLFVDTFVRSYSNSYSGVFLFQYINNYSNDNDLDTTNASTKNPRGNTEYRLQFAWPNSRNATDTHPEELKPAGGGSRRFAYMATVGHEKPAVPVHKKRIHDMNNKKEGKLIQFLTHVYVEAGKF